MHTPQGTMAFGLNGMITGWWWIFVPANRTEAARFYMQMFEF
jgi:cbb3-type cytochrome oxidase subunit 3